MPGFSHDQLFSPLLLDAQPDLFGRTCVPADRAVFYAGRDLYEPWNRVIEELLIAFAEIAFSFIALLVQTCSVFHTTAAADIEVPAYETFVT